MEYCPFKKSIWIHPEVGGSNSAWNNFRDFNAA
jgi:hypothetical protein